VRKIFRAGPKLASNLNAVTRCYTEKPNLKMGEGRRCAPGERKRTRRIVDAFVREKKVHRRLDPGKSAVLLRKSGGDLRTKKLKGENDEKGQGDLYGNAKRGRGYSKRPRSSRKGERRLAKMNTVVILKKSPRQPPNRRSHQPRRRGAGSKCEEESHLPHPSKRTTPAHKKKAEGGQPFCQVNSATERKDNARRKRKEDNG